MGDDSGPDGFMGCECICYNQAMRRLLNVIRNSQSICTDTECFEPGLPNNLPSNSIFFLTVMIGITVMLFFLRPSRRNQVDETLTKPMDNGSNNGPPAPPVD